MNTISITLSKKQISKFWKVDFSPNVLYVQGSKKALKLLDRLPEYGLAIVGTRHPTRKSLEIVKKSVFDLRGSDLIIISGFAKGIDGCAHIAALETELSTIAVMASGLDVCYPDEHKELKDKILSHDGLILSEYPLGIKIKRHLFLERNRLIAGLAKATWIVEAPQKSGALNTAAWAREFEKNCYATPCYPNDDYLRGNQNLLDNYCALPFWGMHSLGSTWLEVLNLPKKQVFSLETLTQDEKKMLEKTHQLIADFGGVQVEDLLNWALLNEWNTNKFFTNLKNLVNKQFLIDDRGFLLKNSAIITL
ncbi:MAG: DNA-protecting protein DprA [Deltaproteobacteria bacterium]|nr:DNA-protecting protein DprA [Deltaproteobacteria bacterium]